MTQALTHVFCLGATKAGTSWLHDQLVAHPECRLRAIKEYHYFSKVKSADFQSVLTANEHEIARLTARNATRLPEQCIWAKGYIADLQAYAPVLALQTQNAVAFAGLLASAPGVGHVVGDFTPAYALLSEEKLVEIAKFAPDTRAIYLIRDPVARLWSHIRMVASRSNPADMAEAAWGLLRRVVDLDPSGDAQGIVQRGDYAAIIPKISRAFHPSRLLIMFYEEMMTAPGFARICAFLGIANRPADFGRKVHAGKALGLTASDRSAAARFLRPQYEFVANRFPVLPDAWQSAMNEA